METLKLHVHQGAASGSLVFLADKENTETLPSWISESRTFKAKADADANSISTYAQGDDFAVVVLLNKVDEYPGNASEDARRLGAQVTPLLNTEKADRADVMIPDALSDFALPFLEGVVLANYKYNAFKSKPEENTLAALYVKSELTEVDLEELTNVCEAVYMARNLVNEPVITLNAEAFSKAMQEGGKRAGYSVKVLGKAEIEAEKMGGLLGVNRGSDDPPTFNVLEYKPEDAINEQPLVLVGKGVVYDTGGNNLKPGGYMLTMKSDMGGGAAVTGGIYAIAKNELPVWTIALIPATDNRIGKNALVADDVITISDGTTVEVKNTDAEGRLILADALVYAKRFNPMLVIDMATLTGAAEAITSHFGIAMTQAADEEWVELVKESGEAVYERIMELPFWREYDELLKSDIADISNLGGPKGGAITAGKFLHHFTDYDWIHLDIAGPAYLEAAKDYRSAGGTGAGVRLAYAIAKGLIT